MVLRFGAVAAAALALLWLAAGWSMAAPQPDHKASFYRIDAYVAAELEADRVPGAALVITRGDRVVHVRGFGTDGAGEPVDPDTPFLLGSMSKSFTALAVMKLVDEGKIGLDKRVLDYLPWFRVSGGGGDAITVRHLLAHTSGIPTLAPRAKAEDATLRSNVEALSAVSLVATPGARHEYASPNYLVLGAVVEAVTGRSFEDYVRREILVPLKMGHSFTSQQEAVRAGLSRGHRYWFGVPIPVVLPPEPGRLPTAAMISSAADLGKFMILQQGGGLFEGRRLISPEAAAAMHEGTAVGEGFRYAMGWRVSDMDGVAAVHHGGVLPHFRGKMVMLPGERWGVAVLTNASSALPAEATSHRIADRVALALAGKPLPEPRGELTRLYLGATGVMGLLTVGQIWKVWKLRRWRERAAKSLRAAWTGVVVSLIVPVVLLVGLPALQGLPLSASMRSAPDITWWLLIFSAVEIAIALWKAFSLSRLTATASAH